VLIAKCKHKAKPPQKVTGVHLDPPKVQLQRGKPDTYSSFYKRDLYYFYYLGLATTFLSSYQFYCSRYRGEPRTRQGQKT